MKIMKRLTSILALAALTLFPACENGDWSFPDYDYSPVYFAYQFPVRTLTLGNDEEYNNDLDNEHKCKIKAVLGGVYENGANRIIDIEVDNSLCDDLYFSTGEKVEPMPAGYYQLAADQIVIPKGEISGGVEVQFTDAFFADPKSLLTNYVIPLRMTDVQNADSILQGQPNVDNPDPRITSDWVEQPKNFVLYAVKYVNPWDGILLTGWGNPDTEDAYHHDRGTSRSNSRGRPDRGVHHPLAHRSRMVTGTGQQDLQPHPEV